MAMMAMTTKSSIRVKAERRWFFESARERTEQVNLDDVVWRRMTALLDQ
jgi:macrodomain Ter protein organizer (MatP/YcbG family)